jgi:hypothetical protein
MTIVEAAPVPLNSTLLASVSYDPGESLLHINFRDGAIYRYFAVPAAVHNGLLTADSKGSYFNSHIRGRFRYSRLRRPL